MVRQIGRRTRSVAVTRAVVSGGISGCGFRQPLTHQFHNSGEGSALLAGRLVQFVRMSAFLRGLEPGHGFHELAHGRRFLARDLVDAPHRRGWLSECFDSLGFIDLARFAEARGELVAGAGNSGRGRLYRPHISRSTADERANCGGPDRVAMGKPGQPRTAASG